MDCVCIAGLVVLARNIELVHNSSSFWIDSESNNLINIIHGYSVTQLNPIIAPLKKMIMQMVSKLKLNSVTPKFSKLN